METQSAVLPKKSFYGKRRFKGKYGKPWLSKLTRRENELKDYPTPLQYKARLDGPSTEWEIFRRQEDAFSFARHHENELQVIAFESESFFDQHGQRMFLATTYEQFWHFYQQLTPSRRHHYEVIPEGAVCHLYFDLEYHKEYNSNADGNKMVQSLIKYICACLEEELKIKCDENHILQLDASTSMKFSRHLIFHLPQAAFKDNSHAGNFVCHIMGKLWNNIYHTTDQCYGQNENHSCVSEISHQHDQEHEGSSDFTTKVTTNDNECINLVTSTMPQLSEMPSQGHEESSSDFTTNVNTNNNECTNRVTSTMPHDRNYNNTASSDIGGGNLRKGVSEQIISQSGVTLHDMKSLIVKDKHQHDILFCDLGVYTRNRNFRLYLSSKIHKDNPLLLADCNKYTVHSEKPSVSKEELLFYASLICNIKYSKDLRILTFDASEDELSSCHSKSSQKEENNLTVSGCLQGYQHSPHPEVDLFVSGQLSKGGSEGYIRQWMYFTQGELLLYEIAKNRWCENVGRQHKSNNIMIVVDMKKGVYYQKCHDPDCKAIDFKSNELSLPDNIALTTMLEKEDETEMGDEDLLLAADQVELNEEMSDSELLEAALEVELSS